MPLLAVVYCVLTMLAICDMTASAARADAPDPTQPTVDAALRERALGILREAAAADDVRDLNIAIRAGEALASLDYLEGLRDTFEVRLARFGDEPGRRVGIWRVLAMVNFDPVHRSDYIERTIQAAVDVNSPDRVEALASLARLGFAAGRRSALRATLQNLADGDGGPAGAYATIVLSRDDSGQIDRLLAMLNSPNVAVRHAAADGLSEMGVRAAGREAEIAAALLTAARREGDSTARPHLVAAAYLRGSEAAQNELRPTLHQWVLGTAADGRPQVITVMGIAGAVEELPRLIECLGDGDAEVRVAAAAAVLRLGRHAPRRLAALDWMVIGIYGVGMLAVGWHYSRRTATTDDYLLGGRNMKPWAAGVSLFVTLLSTISFLSTPGEMIKHGPMFFASILDLPLVLFIAGWLLIPYIMRLKVTSAYEILELRLGLSVRMLGSATFLVLRLMWMATIIYATVAKVLVPLAGLDPGWEPWLCLAMGGVTVAYTSLGGLRAVIWTDVIQAVVLFGGTLLVMVTVTLSLGGAAAWWPTSWPENWPEPRWGFETDARVTFGWVVMSSIIWWTCTIGSDQMSIQRCLATRDVRAARRVLAVSKLSEVLVVIFLALIGLAMLAYFRANPHLMPPGQTIYANADQLLPQYIAFSLPAGVTGIIIASLLAAAMSSLSSGLNSSCAVITSDFVDRFSTRKLAEHDHVRLARLISVVVGAVVVGLSLFVGTVSGNLLEIAFRVVNLLTVPLFVLFFMAMFVPWATVTGTWAAELCSIAAAVSIAYYEDLFGVPGPSFLWIMPASLIVGVCVGLIASLIPLGPGPRRSLRELTAATVEQAASSVATTGHARPDTPRP